MNMWHFAATFFYLGKLPFIPGSWGSLGALILWIFLPLSYSLQLMIIILMFSIGIISSKKMADATNDPDPSEVVTESATRNLPYTRAGVQDEVCSQANSPKLTVSLATCLSAILNTLSSTSLST